MKFQKYMEQVESGYVKGITYPELMEMVSELEAILKRTLPVSFSCPTCVYNIVKLYKNVKYP